MLPPAYTSTLKLNPQRRPSDPSPLHSASPSSALVLHSAHIDPHQPDRPTFCLAYICQKAAIVALFWSRSPLPSSATSHFGPQPHQRAKRRRLFQCLAHVPFRNVPHLLGVCSLLWYKRSPFNCGLLHLGWTLSVNGQSARYAHLDPHSCVFTLYTARSSLFHHPNGPFFNININFANLHCERSSCQPLRQSLTLSHTDHSNLVLALSSLGT